LDVSPAIDGQQTTGVFTNQHQYRADSLCNTQAGLSLPIPGDAWHRDCDQLACATIKKIGGKPDDLLMNVKIA